jgi:ABC-type transport system involved in multi-copper enzyme maturation permease subunit
VTASVAAFEVPRELREKTAQFILTKPMGRSSFVWGKFLGVSLLAVFNIAIVAAGSVLVYYFKYEEVALGIVKASVLLAGMAVILVGVGLVFSMFLSDTLSAVGVFIVFALGHMLYMWGRTSAAGNAIANIFPNFYNLDIKTEVPADVPVDNTFVYWGIAYAIFYGIALTGLATLLFSRKDVS